MTGSGTGALFAWLSPANLGIDRFDAPERLPWLLVAALLALGFAARRGPAALLWPAVSQLAEPSGLRVGRGVAWLVRGAILAALALALCEPVSTRWLPPEAGPGLDLVLVLDASRSMETGDARDERGRAMRRIDLARRVVGRFAAQRIEAGDRIGLVVFGAHAFTQCPLTHDGGLLSAALERVDVGVAGDATALGDALALAVERAGGADGAAGQAVVLLTDGRSNAGRIPVSVALELADAAGVRVHSVAIGDADDPGADAEAGGAQGAAAAHAATPGSGATRAAPAPADRSGLAEAARITGGSFFVASAAGDLEAVYASIDALERTPRPRPARRVEQPRSEALLAGAGLLLLGEIVVNRVGRRRLPT